MADNFLTFEQTMEKLGVTEEELLNMVASNELRAFMKNREMHFKDVDISGVTKDIVADAVVEEKEAVDDGLQIDDGVLVIADDEDNDLAPPEAEVITEQKSAIKETVITDAVGVDSEDISEMLDDEPDSDNDLIVEPDEEIIEPEAVTETSVEVVMGNDTEDKTIIIDDDISIEDDEIELSVESDSGVGLGTEEIVFEDDDLSIGLEDEDEMVTEQVTIEEEAISVDDDELAIEDDVVAATAIIDDDDMSIDEEPEAIGRGGAKRSQRTSARRRPPVDSSEKIPTGSLIWAIPIAATFLISLIPLTSLFSEISQGFSIQPSTYTGAEIDYNAPIPKSDGLFVPEHLEPLIGVKDGELDPQGALSWMGELRKVDNKMTLKKFADKYGTIPPADSTEPSAKDKADAGAGDSGSNSEDNNDKIDDNEKKSSADDDKDKDSDSVKKDVKKDGDKKKADDKKKSSDDDDKWNY